MGVVSGAGEDVGDGVEESVFIGFSSPAQPEIREIPRIKTHMKAMFFRIVNC